MSICDKCNGAKAPPRKFCKACGNGLNRHYCHIPGCEKEVPPEKLMCRAHWGAVSKTTQQDVYRQYRPGQCDDKRPSKAWHAAADRAIKEAKSK